MTKFYIISIIVFIFSMLVYWAANPFDSELVRNKRVLITGASQNIGRAVAIEYAKLGANIVVTARNEERLKEVVDQCKKMGATTAHYIVADMSRLEETETVIARAVALLGGLDFLVLNHVLSVNPGFWNNSAINLEQAQRSAVVNYLSYIYLSTFASPYLEESNGNLIIVSSLAGYIYTTQQGTYGATKAALNHFYSDLRLEMALQKKRLYSITICLLGTIATENSRWEKYPVEIKSKGHPLASTAEEILIGGAMKKAYVFIPKWTVVTSVLRMFATDYFDNIYLKYLYKT